jgi:hypothetical protein
MSRNGSGTYNLPAGNPVVSGTTITSSWANTTMQNIADGLTQSVASDGQTPMSGALNMGNNKVINVTDPTNAQDAATKNYVDATVGTTYLAKANNLSDVANATTSRTNLVAAKSGANSDITSLTGLTTPLTVAQGGTGAATLTANNVLLGNGTSAPQVVAPSTSGNILTSNGTTWTSAAPAPVVVSGLGFNGETWHSVSRSASTVYQNNRAYPIMVNVGGVGSSSTVSFYCDATTSPTQIAATSNFGGSNVNGNVPSVIVPPYFYYSCTASGGTWYELY